MITKIRKGAVQYMIICINMCGVWKIIITLNVKEKSSGFIVAEWNEERPQTNYYKNQQACKAENFIKMSFHNTITPMSKGNISLPQMKKTVWTTDGTGPPSLKLRRAKTDGADSINYPH
ncbi:MAG TPA: hypothetical protein VNX68_14105 [Nitrosopumilaceae archaeon]|nr:hypothetical protein [Nitrosopumilaceae archaeon]